MHEIHKDHKTSCHHCHGGEEHALEEKDRLIKRIEHWKHHNEDHLKSYKEWALKAAAEGYSEVAERLEFVCKKAEEQASLFDEILVILRR